MVNVMNIANGAERMKMTRLEQAMRWWANQKGTIFANLIPDRHKIVLMKNGSIKFNYGVVSAEDYYTLRD